MAETHGLSSDTSAIQSPEVGSSLTPAGTAVHCGTGTSLLRVMAGGPGCFCTGPSPPSTLPLRQCAALTVSTDCSQVQRAELGTATEQRDRTASCHPVPCVEPAAAKAVGSVAWAAQLSPASSGHRRRAWSKRLQEPVSARASPSSRCCVLQLSCSYDDVFRGSDWIRAHSCQGSVHESGRRVREQRHTARRGCTTVRRAPCGKVSIFTVWEHHLETAPPGAHSTLQ